MPNYKSVEEAKLLLVPEIDKVLAAKGYWNRVTSPVPLEAGYDPTIHFALEWLSRHPPQGWHIERTPQVSGCTLWTLTNE